MTTARLISGPPLVEFPTDADGRRVLWRTLVVDLGELYLDLHAWDGLRGRVRLSEENTTVIHVESGIVYDGSSQPWFTHPIMGPKELYEAAAAVHDALYQWGAPREAADAVFWRIARSGSKHVGPVRSWFGWVGVRAGGWVAYRRHRRSRLLRHAVRE